MLITGIVALDQDNGLAKNSRIPWKDEEDMSRFKYLTMNKPILITRTSWSQIKAKKLVGRYLYVTSTSQEGIEKTKINKEDGTPYLVKSALNRYSLLKILYDFKSMNSASSDEVVIAGGPSLYNSLMPLIDLFYVGRIPGCYDCDQKLDITGFTLIKTIPGKNSNLEMYARTRN